MKHNVRILALILSLALCMGASAGCGSNSSFEEDSSANENSAAEGGAISLENQKYQAYSPAYIDSTFE